MFSPSSTEIGRTIFLLAYQSENIPVIAESLYAEVSSSLQIDFDRFRNEYVFLRLFVADYALDSAAITSPRLRGAREIYMDYIKRMAKDNPRAKELLSDIYVRFETYARAVNDYDHNGPAFAIAVAFLEVCGDTGRDKNSSAVIAVCLEFTAILQIVAHALK
jgi:hypothetical protein